MSLTYIWKNVVATTINIRLLQMATLTVEGISPLLQHMILPAAILREEASGCRSEGERKRSRNFPEYENCGKSPPIMSHEKQGAMWTVVHTTKLCEISKL